MSDVEKNDKPNAPGGDAPATPRSDAAAPELKVDAETRELKLGAPAMAAPPKSGKPWFPWRLGGSEKQATSPPPRGKKRRDGALSAMSGFLSFVLVVLVAGIFGLISARHVLNEPGPLRADKIVFMPPGSDTPEILAQLEREGVIDNPLLLNAALLVENKRGALRAGEYMFHQAVSLQEVMDQLVAGRQLLHAVTIPEGLTSEQIAQRLRENDVLAGDIMETPKEGALLPETYKVARGYSRAKLLVKMQEDQRKLIDQIWARRSRDLPFRTPFELVTLASIVEKETGKAEERPHVAAVFVNRLRKGMRLQSDPTIVYGLVGGKATLGRGLLRSELDKYTPYNTYVIDGLPPGPIANPGRAALEAVANPASSTDLYFVADGTGGHVFAETLDQHNRNVQRWRHIERDNKEKTAPEPDHPAPGIAPPAPRDQHGDAGGIGRLVALTERHDDFPPGRAMAADDGATHRLGKLGPWAGLFAVDSLDDPTDEDLRPLARARPLLTLAAAQPRSYAGFDPTAMIASAPPENNEVASTDEVAFESEGGKALLDGHADVGSYPVSARARAEQKARAAKYGLSGGSDQLSPGIVGEPDTAASDA
ncbi:MAG: endolytic transglycosylase MltG, partial [Methylocystis sp.]